MNEQNAMMNYIHEIPEKLINILKSNQIDSFLNSKQKVNYEDIIIIGSGSSFNAGIISRNLFNNFAKIKVTVIHPSNSNIINTKLYNKENTLVIGISQTGTSRSTIDAINFFKKERFDILTITNQCRSQLQSLGNYHLNLFCGNEDSNAKTKGFINTVLLLYKLAMKLAIYNKYISLNLYNQFIKEIQDVAGEIPNTIDKAEKWVDKNINYSLLNQSIIVTSEEYFGAALEASTKLLETTGNLSAPIDYLEFSHGLHRTVNDMSNLYMVLGKSNRDDMLKTVKYMKEKVNQICIINIVYDNKDKIEHFINILFVKLS